MVKNGHGVGRSEVLAVKKEVKEKTKHEKWSAQDKTELLKLVAASGTGKWAKKALDFPNGSRTAISLCNQWVRLKTTDEGAEAIEAFKKNRAGPSGGGGQVAMSDDADAMSALSSLVDFANMAAAADDEEQEQAEPMAVDHHVASGGRAPMDPGQSIDATGQQEVRPDAVEAMLHVEFAQPGPIGIVWIPEGKGSRRREFCHFADALPPSLLKHLLKVEGGVQHE